MYNVLLLPGAQKSAGVATTAPAPAAKPAEARPPGPVQRICIRIARICESWGLTWIAPLVLLCAGEQPGYQMRRLLRVAGLPLVAITIAILSWHMVATTVHIGSLVLPTPGQVWDRGAEQVREWRADRVARVEHTALVAKTAAEQGMTVAQVLEFMPFSGKKLFLTQVWLSIQTVFVGVGAGLLIAIPIGILCGLSTTIQAMLDPLIQVLKPVSPLAWFPLVYLVINAAIHGQDPMIGKSFLIAAIVVGLCSLWPALLNTANGVANVERDHLNVARVLNLSWPRRVWSIILPSAAPAIFTGIRVSLGVGWMVLIAAEMMAVSPGIGGFVWDWYQSSNDVAMSYLVLAVFVIGAIGFLLDRMCTTAQRIIAHGSPSSVR